LFYFLASEEQRSAEHATEGKITEELSHRINAINVFFSCVWCHRSCKNHKSWVLFLVSTLFVLQILLLKRKRVSS